VKPHETEFRRGESGGGKKSGSGRGSTNVKGCILTKTRQLTPARRGGVSKKKATLLPRTDGENGGVVQRLGAENPKGGAPTEKNMGQNWRSALAKHEVKKEGVRCLQAHKQKD